jgi:hypothetical protein
LPSAARVSIRVASANGLNLSILRQLWSAMVDVRELRTSMR